MNRTRIPWRWSLFIMDWRFLRGLDWIYDVMDQVWLEPVLGTEEEVETFFRGWETDVRTTVSDSRLLVFQARDGWLPLCEFLGVQVPSSNYPRLNNAQQFKTGYTR